MGFNIGSYLKVTFILDDDTYYSCFFTLIFTTHAFEVILLGDTPLNLIWRCFIVSCDTHAKLGLAY